VPPTLSAFIRVHPWLIGFLFLASAAFSQQPPPQLDTRDLVRKPASFSTNAQTGQPMVATGYALVIGVGNFKDTRLNAKPLWFRLEGGTSLTAVTPARLVREG